MKKHCTWPTATEATRSGAPSPWKQTATLANQERFSIPPRIIVFPEAEATASKWIRKAMSSPLAPAAYWCSRPKANCSAASSPAKASPRRLGQRRLGALPHLRYVPLPNSDQNRRHRFLNSNIQSQKRFWNQNQLQSGVILDWVNPLNIFISQPSFLRVAKVGNPLY